MPPPIAGSRTSDGREWQNPSPDNRIRDSAAGPGGFTGERSSRLDRCATDDGRRLARLPCVTFFARPDAMPLGHRFLKTTRTIHLYLGVFTAPMLLFLAVTGGLQVFGMHEAHRGSDYRPPAWLASMAHLHKKQSLVVPPRKPRPARAETPAGDRTTAAAPAPHAASDRGPAKNPLPMKIFFALVALGLLVSVLSGLYMAWRFSRRPGLFGAVLAGGIAVPVLLLLF